MALRPADRREHVLDAAERLARARGWHGFSFRDVAEAVGIRSASVHHHFPAKEDLGTALAARYTARFLAGLGEPRPDALPRLVAAYRVAVVPDDLMCLCGMLAAEIGGLPGPVAGEVARFFQAVTGWADAAIGAADGRGEALVAGLEGALLAARAGGGVAAFDRIAARMLAAVS